MWKHYYTVTSIDEALSLLDTHQERARIIAGGTDLIIELERGKRPDVDTIIDISRVVGLDQISEHGNQFHIGPLVSHNHVVGSFLLRGNALPLVQACWEVGAPQIRNRATIVGNLITASPANDTITPLWALDANITIRSHEHERTVPIDEFYTGFRSTDLKPNEMVTNVSFRKLESNERGIFIKLGLRRAQAISVINLCIILKFSAEDDKIENARITLGSVAPTIIRLQDIEQSVIGQQLSDDVIRYIAKQIAAVPSPIDDVRGTADYRTEMLKQLTARALRQLRDNTQGQNLPENPAMLWGDNQTKNNASLPSSIHHEDDSAETIMAVVNGETYSVNSGVNKTLLDFLREDIGLTGTKSGCAEGECGACTVFLDGAAVMSCMVGAPRAHGAEVVTIEGLAENGELHPLQQAFIETGAVQCGFCIPGFLMSGAKLLDEKPQPTQEQISQSISGNLCRCTGYYKIIEAFNKASKSSSSSG